MATKKTASASARATKRPTAKKQTTTKVKTTTVKAVETRPAAATAKSSSWVKDGSSTGALIAALVAEFVGTFLLAAVVIGGQGNPLVVLFGLIGIVLAVGTVSHGFVNPALTVAAWVTRRISLVRAIGYIVAQVLGAMLALVVLNAFLGGAPQAADASMFGQQAPSLFKASVIPTGKEWYVFFAELLGTLIFGFAVAAATRELKERTAAAATVGIGLFLGLMIAGSAAALVSGTAILNPAVAVALQGLSWNVWPIAVYVFAAIIGAVVGFLLFDVLRRYKKD